MFGDDINCNNKALRGASPLPCTPPRQRAQRELPSNSIPSVILISLMPDDSYRLIGKDRMEPSILLRKLRPWRTKDADGAKSLVHAVLDKYEHNAWRCDPFRWETSVCPLFYFAKDRDMPDKAVYERVFDWASPPPDEIAKPSLKAMLGPVANAEVDLLIESANYFIFIEAKVRKKSGAKPRFQRNKEEYWIDSPVGPPVCTGPDPRKPDQQRVHVSHAWRL